MRNCNLQNNFPFNSNHSNLHLELRSTLYVTTTTTTKRTLESFTSKLQLRLKYVTKSITFNMSHIIVSLLFKDKDNFLLSEKLNTDKNHVMRKS